MEHKNYIIVTDWEKVRAEDFYLSDAWKENKERYDELKELQEKGRLYIAYIVDSISYAIYMEMDAQQIFINDDMDIILQCESAIIGNSHCKRIECPEYNY